MTPRHSPNRLRIAHLGMDRLGIALSGLCAAHCVAGLVLVSLLGAGSVVIGSPLVHQLGLVLAVLVAGLSLGFGFRAHRRAFPLALGLAGLAAMAVALLAPHGPAEAVLTLAGVVAVAIAHLANLRPAR